MGRGRRERRGKWEAGKRRGAAEERGRDVKECMGEGREIEEGGSAPFIVVVALKKRRNAPESRLNRLLLNPMFRDVEEARVNTRPSHLCRKRLAIVEVGRGEAGEGDNGEGVERLSLDVA